MTETKVAVVIPTSNSAKTLEQCLASIRANNSRYEYEVIVADAESSDETVKIAKKYADKVINGVPRRINRNLGIKNTQGDIICFTNKGDGKVY